jgi:hypothetical protein
MARELLPQDLSPHMINSSGFADLWGKLVSSLRENGILPLAAGANTWIG